MKERPEPVRIDDLAEPRFSGEVSTDAPFWIEMAQCWLLRERMPECDWAGVAFPARTCAESSEFRLTDIAPTAQWMEKQLCSQPCE